MADQNSADVARKLALLKMRFREKALCALSSLQQSLSRVHSSGVDSGEILSAYQSLHRLAGSAGTFGYSALGREARELEQIIKPFVEKAPGTHDDVSQFLDQSFMRRVEGLSDMVSGGGSESTPTGSALEEGLRDVAEPMVVLVEPEPDRARSLASALTHHGFIIHSYSGLLDVPERVLVDASAVLVRDSLFSAGGNTFGTDVTLPPIICVGSVDGFDDRYKLAENGADGFFPEPVDVPLLADYIERLIGERLELGKGRVLIVDDDPELLEHYGLVLEDGGMNVHKVRSPSELLGALSEFQPDLVLMDVQMGHYSGPTLARMLRFDPEWVGLHIIFLSSEDDREFQVDALSKGGDVFLTKPISDSFLLRAVRVKCNRARQLAKLASRDSLTGLLKHSLVKQEVGKEHSRCRRFGQDSVVAMLDLDHFKLVNDRFGHRTGDLVIKGLANLLRHRLRKTDVIGRYGGEEFLVVMPDCSLENAVEALQAVCEQMRRISYTSKGQEFFVTVSIGLAPLAAFENGEEAIEAADQALYVQKSRGRNGVSVFGEADIGSAGKVVQCTS
ncbi:Putative diguanylate cyclase (GGDEF domain) [Marinobacter nitratireducens]|uniref:diguanylate cyclase n=1 Tax=Marinobacter nitratireducens TaxID=1137280 RepID=A0A072N107_9GAMM|nr:diguanylate cyclase [Marinobacter nitratireducens]KEF30917.1 Putative diguanylate cyclase (GGDEF domain) [Marinobacter nitratireducens]